MSSKILDFTNASSVIWTNATAATITANTVVYVNENILGITHDDILTLCSGTVHVLGRFKLAKDATLTIAIGDRLYWDVANACVTNIPVGNYIGMATIACASTAAYAEFDLNAAIPLITSGGKSDIIAYEDDFIGLTNDFANGWATVDVNDATEAYVAAENGGAVALTIAATSEAEDAVLYHGDMLNFNIDKLRTFECRAKVVTPGTGVRVVFGMASAHNLDKDSVADMAWFSLDASLALKVESDNGTTDNDDVSTGITLTTNVYYWFKIDFTDMTNIKFYVKTAGATTYTQVAATTTFSLAAYTGYNLQPYFSCDKASGTATGSLTIDLVRILCER